MIDQVEALFDQMEEWEDELALELVEVVVPRRAGDGTLADGTLAQRLEDVTLRRMETALPQSSAGEGTEGGALWWGSETTERAKVGGRHHAQATPSDDGGNTLVRQMVERQAAAQVALGLERSGVTAPTRGTGMSTGQTGWSGSSARTIDRTMERDARRYDGGFLLG